MTTKISGIILVLVLTLSIFVFGCSAATGQIQTVAVVSTYGQIIQEPSYTVWTEGGVYYANNTYGAIAYSSPVASNVLNYASAALTTGGTIFIENGIYTVTAMWILSNKNINVVGESWNAILTAANGLDEKMVVFEADNCNISDLSINGNKAGQTGGLYDDAVLFYGASHCTLENDYIYNTYGESISMYETSTTPCRYDTIDNCLVTGAGASGVVMYGGPIGSGWNTVSNTVIINSALDGLYLSGVDYCTCNNVKIYDSGDSACELQGGAGMVNNGGGNTNHAATGNSFTNIEVFNSTNPAILIDGNYNYPVSKTTITNFNVNYTISSTGADGLLLQGNVTDSNIGNGVINNTARNGIDMYANCTNNDIHDVTVVSSASIGAKIDQSCTNNTYDNITVVNSGYDGFDVEPNSANNLIENSKTINSNGVGIIIQSAGVKVENCLVDGTTASSIYNDGIYVPSNNCTISGNTVNNPSGDGINVNGADNQISNNSINNVPIVNSGISLSGAISDNFVHGNVVNFTTPSGGTGIQLWSSGGKNNQIESNAVYNACIGINLMAAGVNATVLANNQLISCSTPIIDSGTCTIIYNNTGYNPVGYIPNPFLENNHILLDSGGNNATWSSAVTYTNWESPKTLYISGGTVTAVVQNGQTIFSTTGCTVVLQPGDTFSITFSSAPTIKVEGQ